MTNISMQISATDQNDKKITTTITYINSNASNEILRQFAAKLNAFTTNTYDGATKITKEEII